MLQTQSEKINKETTLCSCLKGASPHLLWQNKCSIVSSNSFVSQCNPSLTEAQRECVCVFLYLRGGGLCVSL